MALASLNTALPWPNIFDANNGTPSLSSGQTLNGAGEHESVVICAREDMTISHVGFYGTSTGSAEADVRIETVTAATGIPSGTLWAANTNIATGVITSGWNLYQLTAAATITKGQVFAVKIAYSAGTSLVIRTTTGTFSTTNIPYTAYNVGADTKARIIAPYWMALGSSATTFYQIKNLLPISTLNGASTFNNTNGARRGMRFQLPVKARCVGLRWWNSTAVGDFNAGIWDDAGSELSSSSTAFEGDNSAASGSAVVDVFFDNAVTLSPATWYRAAIEPSSATNLSTQTYTLPSLNYRSGWPCGTNCHYTSYASAAWTDTATDTIINMDILLDQFDDGASTGGARVIGG